MAIKRGAAVVGLPCFVYIVWEIFVDLTGLVTGNQTEDKTAGREDPRSSFKGTETKRYGRPVH